MFRLTRNIAIDSLRKKQNRLPRQLVEQQHLNIIPDAMQTTEEQVENIWLGEQVKQAIELLNEDQKRVVEWIYFRGLTQQEVADQYSIPLGTVKSRVRLAMKQLKQLLTNAAERGGNP